MAVLCLRTSHFCGVCYLFKIAWFRNCFFRLVGALSLCSSLSFFLSPKFFVRVILTSDSLGFHLFSRFSGLIQKFLFEGTSSFCTSWLSSFFSIWSIFRLFQYGPRGMRVERNMGTANECAEDPIQNPYITYLLTSAVHVLTPRPDLLICFQDKVSGRGKLAWQFEATGGCGKGERKRETKKGNGGQGQSSPWIAIPSLDRSACAPQALHHKSRTCRSIGSFRSLVIQ